MAGLIVAALAAAALAGVHQYERVAISPDGALVAAVEAVELPGRIAEPHGAVVVRWTADGKVAASFDPCAACTYSDPTWSPDGKVLAFLGADRKAHTAELLAASDGKVAVVAPFAGLLAKPRFSPDGKVLAVLATAHPTKESGATNPGAARVGEIDQAPDERRIAVVQAGGVRLVSPSDRFVYEYDWTPDSAGFVATDAVGGGGPSHRRGANHRRAPGADGLSAGLPGRKGGGLRRRADERLPGDRRRPLDGSVRRRPGDR
jgi:dipeptidyl aminopeptidase/acylaminoacyl peptidase